MFYLEEPTLQCHTCGYEKECCVCEGPECERCGESIKFDTVYCPVCKKYQTQFDTDYD